VVQSFKVLVVEDYEQFRRLLCSLMQQRPGFQITQAADGLAAVAKAEQLQPDLLVLDIGLPGINGLEVARRVRKLVPGARILFISQESSPEVVREALILGARGYVHKPRAGSDLLRAVDTVLRGGQFVSQGLVPTLPSTVPSLDFARTAPEPRSKAHKVLT
jgi:two-component system, NarL family, nitrate/nitrite response regulator NarL